MTVFSNETCLNVRHQHFVFQHIVQIYLNICHTPVRLYERCDCCDRCISCQYNTSARSLLSRPQANFLHQTCRPIVKHLSPYWTYLKVNGIWAQSFCSQKMN